MVGAVVTDNLRRTQHPAIAHVAAESVFGVLDGGPTPGGPINGDGDDEAVIECNLSGFHRGGDVL